MKGAMKGIFRIDGMSVECILGDRPEERVAPTLVSVDAEISFDMLPAAMSDRLEDAVDYVAVAAAARKSLSEAKCNLLERAAFVAARATMGADMRIDSVSLTVSKPGGVEGVEKVSASITLAREECMEGAAP